MKPVTVRPKQMFAKGKAAATDWLADVGKSRERPYPLNVCRAVRQFDMVAQHEITPNFHELLSAWEEGFDSTVAAGLRASGHSHQVGTVAVGHQLLAMNARNRAIWRRRQHRTGKHSKDITALSPTWAASCTATRMLPSSI